MMSEESSHENAAETFAARAQERYGGSIRHLVVFGSTARGDAHGVESDVDVFLVLEDEDCEEPLRDLAYDIGLEYGVVFSIHALSVDRFESRTDHPFIRTVFEEGRTYA